MKMLFYVLAATVAIFAIWSLVMGIREYLQTGAFDLVHFAIAFVGAMLAGLWYRRARSIQG